MERFSSCLSNCPKSQCKRLGPKIHIKTVSLFLFAKSASCSPRLHRGAPHRKKARNYLREEWKGGRNQHVSRTELFIYLMLCARVHSAVEISNLISTAIHHIAGKFFRRCSIGGAPSDPWAPVGHSKAAAKKVLFRSHSLARSHLSKNAHLQGGGASVRIF